MVEKRQVQLAKCNEDEERLLRRLFRTTHALETVRARKKRLLKPRPVPTEAPELNDPVPEFRVKHHPDTHSIAIDTPTATITIDDGLDIPKELDRNRKLQAMADPRTKEKKAERKAVAKEKLQADLTGKRRAMPLQGKAALEAIRKGA